MEIPDRERVTITDLPTGLQITIRAARAWPDFLILVITTLVWGTLVGLLIFRSGLFYPHIDWWAKWFLVIVPLPAAIRELRWYIAGRETITAADGMLTIKTIGRMLFKYDEAFDLAVAKDFRLAPRKFYFGLRFTPKWAGGRGSVRFDYEDMHVDFGDMLSDAQANYIIQVLKDKKLIK